MKKVRLKKFAVQFYNELLKEEKTLEIDAYEKREAMDIANLEIDAKYNNWEDEFAEFFKIKKVELIG